MSVIQKTDTSKSPLLEPVTQRDYTKGINFNTKGSGPAPAPVPDPGPGPATGSATSPLPGENTGPKPNFTPPAGDDNTKPFTFDSETDNASDLLAGEEGPGINIPAGSAKTFANFVGSAIQTYLPKATYGYVKIDMENILVNVEKGTLTGNWIETFEKINKNTEEALKIPDESIKMWKAAFKDWLEYKNIEAANPTTAFVAATVLLLSDQGIRAWSIKQDNEGYVRQGIEASNPGTFSKESRNSNPVTSKINTTDESSRNA